MKRFDDIKLGRRDFLRSSGYLLMGFTLIPGLGFTTGPDECYLPEQILIADREAIDSWIRFDADGILTVLTGKMELGPGIQTALMQIKRANPAITWDIEGCSERQFRRCDRFAGI